MCLVKQVFQAPYFKKIVKRLHANQKTDLDSAIKMLMRSPELGEKKKGNLSYLRVYKFKMAKQKTLLGYCFDEEQLILELLALGAHENFYRDLKN